MIEYNYQNTIIEGVIHFVYVYTFKVYIVFWDEDEYIIEVIKFQ